MYKRMTQKKCRRTKRGMKMKWKLRSKHCSLKRKQKRITRKLSKESILDGGEHWVDHMGPTVEDHARAFYRGTKQGMKSVYHGIKHAVHKNNMEDDTETIDDDESLYNQNTQPQQHVQKQLDPYPPNPTRFQRFSNYTRKKAHNALNFFRKPFRR
jgi:hypothetical protein